MRNLKRVLSLALACVMVIGMMVMTTGAADLKDYDEITNVEAVDIEEKDWIRYAEELVRRNNEETLFKQLKSWYRQTTPWLRDEKDLHRYTLECFVARIFDNPNWVDYEAFNKCYRPELLTKTS